LLAGRDEAWIGARGRSRHDRVTLWRPGITPDHPWADRRFVPVMLPVLVLFATFAVAALARPRWFGSRVSPVGGPGRALVGTVGMAAILIPTVLAALPLWQRTKSDRRRSTDCARACGPVMRSC
jgi:hypothetical protein